MLYGRLGLKNDGLARSYCCSSLSFLFCHVLWSCDFLGNAVRWLLLIPFVLLVNAKSPCTISDFYAITWLGDPSLRHSQLSMWLSINGDNCSSDQLVVIWNNLAMWVGSADSAELRGKILYFYSRAMEREKK